LPLAMREFWAKKRRKTTVVPPEKRRDATADTKGRRKGPCPRLMEK